MGWGDEGQLRAGIPCPPPLRPGRVGPLSAPGEPRREGDGSPRPAARKVPGGVTGAR